MNFEFRIADLRKAGRRAEVRDYPVGAACPPASPERLEMAGRQPRFKRDFKDLTGLRLN